MTEMRNNEEQHIYGDSTVASFEDLEKLPMFGIIELTNYKLGLLEPVSKEELNQILEEWRSTPWKSEEEIAQLREHYFQTKLKNQNEWNSQSECQPTTLSTNIELEECRLQKRKRFDREI